MTPGGHLLLYDGACGRCGGWVRFVAARDRRGAFRFAPLQAAWVKELLRARGRDPEALDTFYVVRGFGGEAPELLSKAQAALFVLGELGGPWRWARALRAVPRRLLDRGYDFIARRRYAGLFGRAAACPRPPAAKDPA